MKELNERNVTGTAITINFHSKWDKKNLSKSKKNVQNHTDWFAARPCTTLHDHAKAKARHAWVFPTSFAVILSAVALPIVLKAEFNFELKMYITIPGNCFIINPQSVFKTHLEGTDILIFAAVKGRKNYSLERFEGSVHLDLPFWVHLNIDLCCSFPF